MVSEDLNSNSNSSILHQFIMSAQNQYPNQQFNAYAVEMNGGATHHPPLGLLPTLQPLGDRMFRPMDFGHLTEESEDNQGRNFMDLLGAAADEANHLQAQRLSLSLGSQSLLPPVQCTSTLSNAGYAECGEGSQAINAGAVGRLDIDYSCQGTVFASTERESVAAAIGNSRYLKPTQSLLEEVVSVDGKRIGQTNEKYVRKLSRNSKTGSLGLVTELRAELSNTDQLVSDKYELQVRLAKLISLLEEVEVKYERYCNRVEQLVSPFEVVAGLGAGMSYTALALQAISKHFCNLRDAIVSQICYARKNLYEDFPKISNGLSKLSLLDKENRQNRMTLQQLGMVQCSRQTWKPIRGLPETSVTILRSWLFEHFLNPYPNESEKLILASQTGLTKNQVSNWFINARVRLWKPMIEEMYKEEFADCPNESDILLREGVSD
ncbi:homeodomain transcription factor [Lithospermum erythrorhizon]|uniref:Homeodomain transcription factor n=1 Tax=Lithospermum erythrorhizon TaxID=34254 RepID=A0AAV3QP90_LITER